jgi:hypothetical protein
VTDEEKKFVTRFQQRGGINAQEQTAPAVESPGVLQRLWDGLFGEPKGGGSGIPPPPTASKSDPYASAPTVASPAEAEKLGPNVRYFRTPQGKVFENPGYKAQ